MVTVSIALYAIIHLAAAAYIAMPVSLDVKTGREFATTWAFFLLFSFWAIPLILLLAAAAAALDKINE